MYAVPTQPGGNFIQHFLERLYLDYHPLYEVRCGIFYLRSVLSMPNCGIVNVWGSDLCARAGEFCFLGHATLVPGWEATPRKVVLSAAWQGTTQGAAESGTGWEQSMGRAGRGQRCQQETLQKPTPRLTRQVAARKRLAHSARQISSQTPPDTRDTRQGSAGRQPRESRVSPLASKLLLCPVMKC